MAKKYSVKRVHVKAHTVKAHTVKAHKVAAHKVPARRVKAYTKVLHVTKNRSGTSYKPMDRKRSAYSAGSRKTSNPHMHHGKVVRKSTKYFEARRNRSDVGNTRL